LCRILKNRFAWKLVGWNILTYNGTDSTFGKNVSQKVMTIEIIARNGKKQSPGFIVRESMDTPAKLPETSPCVFATTSSANFFVSKFFILFLISTCFTLETT